VAKRNFTRQAISLRTFLQTGRLGPISCGLPLLEVAALIGPPGRWAADVHDFPFPLNWSYVGLDISFSVEAPHRVDLLKLDPARLGRTRFHNLCPLLRLSLDGIPLLGRPSQLLNSGIWELDALKIGLHLDTADPRLIISLTGIELLFVLYDSDAEELATLARDDVKQAIPLFDSTAVLHGIYASTHLPKRPQGRWHEKRADMYLQFAALPKS
jgi:hypothetical protein